MHDRRLVIWTSPAATWRSTLPPAALVPPVSSTWLISNASTSPRQPLRSAHRLTVACRTQTSGDICNKWSENFDEKPHRRALPPKKINCLSPGGSGYPSWYMVPLAHPSPHRKRHFDRFICFRTARGYVQQTDTRTNHGTSVPTTGCNLCTLCMRCGLVTLAAGEMRCTSSKQVRIQPELSVSDFAVSMPVTLSLSMHNCRHQ